MKINLLISLLFLNFLSVFALDSVRVENRNGKQLMVYKVEKGQTLFAIARKYAISVNDIKALNPTLNQLQVGSEIFLPAKSPSPNMTSPSESPKGSDDGEEQLTHLVKPGDTFYKISKQYAVTVQELKEANHDTKSPKVGQEIIIPLKNTNKEKQLDVSTSSQTSTKTETNNKTEQKKSATGYPSITETCRAKLDETLSAETSYTLLHPIASIGTLVLIKNKENGNSVHAKIVGNPKNPESGTILVNKKVFEKLESKTNVFAVEIFYTLEQ